MTMARSGASGRLARFGIGLHPLHLGAVRVDRIDPAAIAEAPKIEQRPAADLVGVLRGADQCDRAGVERLAQIVERTHGGSSCWRSKRGRCALALVPESDAHALADAQSRGAMRHHAEALIEIHQQDVIRDERREVRRRRARDLRCRIDRAQPPRHRPGRQHPPQRAQNGRAWNCAAPHAPQR